MMVLGGVDSAYFTGKFTYHPVTKKNFWLIKMDGLSVNGQMLTSGPITAEIDSGTSAFQGSSSVVDPVNIKLGINGPVFCQEIPKLPPIDVVIDGTSYSIPADEGYIIRVSEFGVDSCMNALQPTTFDKDIGQGMLLGDIFMKFWYTHFDVDNA